GDETDVAIAGAGNGTHDLHHGAVIAGPVATYENALLIAGGGDRLQLGNELVERDLGILQENLALGIDRHRERILVGGQCLGLALRQVERYARRQKRRRHHEDDRKHEHDVDERRHVDLAHHVRAATPASTAPTASRTTSDRHAHAQDLSSI